MRGSYNRYDIKYNERIERKKAKAGSVQLGTSVKYKGLDRPYSIAYTNAIEYGLIRVKDKIYFTLPTTKEYIGERGFRKQNETNSRSFLKKNFN